MPSDDDPRTSDRITAIPPIPRFRLLYNPTPGQLAEMNHELFSRMLPKNAVIVFNASGLLPPLSFWIASGAKQQRAAWVHVIANAPGPSTLALPPDLRPTPAALPPGIRRASWGDVVLPSAKVTLLDPYAWGSIIPMAHWREMELWFVAVDKVDRVPIWQSILGKFVEDTDLGYRNAQPHFVTADDLSVRLHTSARLNRELLTLLLRGNRQAVFARLQTSLGLTDEGHFLPEWGDLPYDEAEKIQAAIKAKRPVIAVGLEIVRLLLRQHQQMDTGVGSYIGWVEGMLPGLPGQDSWPKWLHSMITIPALELSPAAYQLLGSDLQGFGWWDLLYHRFGLKSH